MEAVLMPRDEAAAAHDTQTVHHRLLMCRPDAYELKYEINDWMHLGDQPDLALAVRQWENLYRLLTEEVGVEVELVPQVPNAPDMVFTANAGLVLDGRVMLSRFRHPERQVEVQPFTTWFESHGYITVAPPDGIHFEGEGDALFAGDTLVAGYLKRSDIRAHRWLAAELATSVLSVELIDGRWYHLDTAFFALGPELVAYHPGAFDDYGNRAIRSRFETIVVEEDEALRFACNSVVLGDSIVMPSGCPKVSAELQSRGWTVHPIEMSEFMKCGGAAKCLTLFLD